MTARIDQVLDIIETNTGFHGGAYPDRGNSGEITVDEVGEASFHLRLIDTDSDNISEWEIYDMECEAHSEEKLQLLVTATRNLSIGRPDAYFPDNTEYPKHIRVRYGGVPTGGNITFGTYKLILQITAVWSL